MMRSARSASSCAASPWAAARVRGAAQQCAPAGRPRPRATVQRCARLPGDLVTILPLVSLQFEQILEPPVVSEQGRDAQDLVGWTSSGSRAAGEHPADADARVTAGGRPNQPQRLAEQQGKVGTHGSRPNAGRAPFQPGVNRGRGSGPDRCHLDVQVQGIVLPPSPATDSRSVAGAPQLGFRLLTIALQPH